MSLASVTAQQNTAAAANASAVSAAAAGTSAAASTGSTALNSLSSNFGDFLNLLMTQLQNQDPTSPLDTNQFTTELVQFSSVEQQINTNTSLTQLIQLTQGGEVMQASAMTGKQVTVSSDHMPLQNGTGTIKFTTPAAEPVGIAIYSDSGAKLARTVGPGTARTMPAMPWRTAVTRWPWSAATPTAAPRHCRSALSARRPAC
jgi:flagellar basal-body rod modification protein FlgD